MKDESLSDKIWINPYAGVDSLDIKDVKEFIKKLKEEMFKSWQENKWSYQLIKYKIDKRAGKELI